MNRTYYDSPIGRLWLAEEKGALTGLWIEGQKYFPELLHEKIAETAVLCEAKAWLNRYFAGEQPAVQELKLAPTGSNFRKEVWNILCRIPYGKTRTYGEIAEELAERHGVKSMSAQAVGGAVGHNPISIMIPCHRVVGANGNLTGYAGGIEKKMWLLKHENAQCSALRESL